MAEIAKHAGIAANPRYITFPPKAVESQKQTGRGQKQGPFVPATINDRLASN